MIYIFKTQILIRMCVDNRLPEAERRNYKSVFDAWRRIAGEEGNFQNIFKNLKS